MKLQKLTVLLLLLVWSSLATAAEPNGDSGKSAKEGVKVISETINDIRRDVTNSDLSFDEKQRIKTALQNAWLQSMDLFDWAWKGTKWTLDDILVAKRNYSKLEGLLERLRDVIEQNADASLAEAVKDRLAKIESGRKLIQRAVTSRD